MPINFFKHLYNGNNSLITRIGPPESLQDFVEGFYVFKTHELNGRQLFFNDGYPVIAFMQKQSSRLTIHVKGSYLSIGNAWVCGGILKKIYCESSPEHDELFVIRFKPVTFFKLFNLRGHTFKHKSVFDLAEIIDGDCTTFNKSFYKANSIEQKVELASNFLINRISAQPFPNLLKNLIDHIEQQQSTTVSDITKAFGARVTYKWLERNFTKHIGISPKDYLLLKRFLNAYRGLHSSSPALLQVALENGYYDDNHLIKDFRNFSGKPPKAFFENMTENKNAI
jgi:AraC-like DNA-binding protein